jgi:hypothetical protein
MQAPRDLGDGGAAGAGLEHLALARRERALAVLERGGGKLGIDDALAGRGAANRVGEPLRGRVLDEEAGRN